MKTYLLALFALSAFLSKASMSHISKGIPISSNDTFKEQTIHSGVGVNGTHIWEDPVSMIQDISYNQGLSFLKDMIFVIDQWLKWMFRKLQSFIHDRTFDSESFRKESDTIRTHLVWLSGVIPQTHVTELSDRSRHITHMFDLMTKASTYMEYLCHEENEDESIAREMVQLRVVLLALRDEYGNPEFKLPGFTENVERITWFVGMWKQMFYVSPYTSYMARIIFESEVVQAQKILDILASYTR
ncbi:hypothetical protein JCM33374_g4290 [Metschnikowia sp. JCM 33374]|nr:hypothetical protein JCM33374_g4290 [Metschnikowia sp. JCM 33374]